MNERNLVLIPGKVHPRVDERLSASYEVARIPRAAVSELTEEMTERTVAIADMTAIDADFIDALPHLKIIAHFGVGYDSVDANHAAKKGVIVTHTPDVLSAEVADTTIGLLLNTLRELPKAEAYLREGRWVSEGNYPLTPLSLSERQVGIFGLGRIGLEIAKRLGGFDLPIHYHTRTKREVDFIYHESLVGLASAVDTLIVIVPGGPATENAVNAPVLEALGSNGVLINVGRGSTVDEDALVSALKSGAIAAAGLDVFDDEPNVSQALLDLPNVSLLPHVASASVYTRNAMADLVVNNIGSYLNDGSVLTPVPESAALV